MTSPVLVFACHVEESAGIGSQTATLCPPSSALILSVYAPHHVPLNPFSAVAEAVLHVPEEFEAADRAAAQAAANAAAAPLSAAGWPVDTRTERDVRPAWEVALEVAEEVDAALIVAGAGHHGFARPGALGRETRALAHRTKRPLLVVPTPPPDAAPTGPVFVAFDGSPPSEHALDLAARVLGPREAVVLTGWMPLATQAAMAAAAAPIAIAAAGAHRLDDATRDAAAATAADGAARLTAAGWSVTSREITVTPSVWPGLVAAAREADASLIVTGSRGHSRIAAALIGSVAEGIVRHAERPVLLLPAEREG